MTETKAELKSEHKAEMKEMRADAKAAVRDAGHALIHDAIREIETVVAAQWGNEKFNEGARAAAAVLRAKVGLGADEPLPSEAP